MISSTQRILVIGAEIGYIIAHFLPSQGYQTKFVRAYGEPPRDEVLSELYFGSYDMVIIAFWMSFELLLEIRKRFPQIKTIFLNTFKSEWDEIAKQKGVDKVLQPPFEMDELTTAIRQLL